MRVKTRLANLEIKIKHGIGRRAGVMALYDPRNPDRPPVVPPGQLPPGRMGTPPIAILLPMKDDLRSEPI